MKIYAISFKKFIKFIIYAISFKKIIKFIIYAIQKQKQEFQKEERKEETHL